MACPRYNSPRTVLFHRVNVLLSRVAGGGYRRWRRQGYNSTAPSWNTFASYDSICKLHIFLGKGTGDPYVDNGIDMAFKRFVVRAWSIRRHVTNYYNIRFGRND